MGSDRFLEGLPYRRMNRRWSPIFSRVAIIDSRVAIIDGFFLLYQRLLRIEPLARYFFDRDEGIRSFSAQMLRHVVRPMFHIRIVERHGGLSRPGESDGLHVFSRPLTGEFRVAGTISGAISAHVSTS